jgi:hypothetical protein
LKSFGVSANEGLDTDENIYMSGTTAGLTKSASGTISNLAHGINSDQDTAANIVAYGSTLQSIVTGLGSRADLSAIGRATRGP